MAMDHTGEGAGAETTELTRRPAIVAVAGQTALLFTLTTLPTPLYRDYAEADDFSVLTLTLIYATYVVGTISTLAFLGRLSDQIGRRPVALMALGVAGLAALAFALSHALPMLFVARLATGIASGLSSGAAVAWLQELYGRDRKKDASTFTVAVNNFGLGLGPLLCGWLAEFAPWPLSLSYVVYIVLVALSALALWRTHETVDDPRPPEQVSLRPRIGVPRNLVGRFVAPAVIAFVIFSLVGFFSAITPSLIAEKLGIESHAASGSIVFELFAVSIAAAYLGRRLSSRAAMLWGDALMLPTLALLVVAQAGGQLWALLVGTAFGGLSLGIGYLGTLEVVNAMAPDEKRAELTSSLFICGNLGLAVPVLGVGVTAAIAGQDVANLSFAGVIALLSVAGLVFGFVNRAQQSEE